MPTREINPSFHSIFLSARLSRTLDLWISLRQSKSYWPGNAIMKLLLLFPYPSERNYYVETASVRFESISLVFIVPVDDPAFSNKDIYVNNFKINLVSSSIYERVSYNTWAHTHAQCRSAKQAEISPLSIYSIGIMKFFVWLEPLSRVQRFHFKNASQIRRKQYCGLKWFHYGPIKPIQPSDVW